MQARLAHTQAERDRLDTRATTAERDLASATSDLEEARLNLKVKLEEQQNQFRAIEEEQYGDWEKRVSVCYCCSVMSWSTECRSLQIAEAAHLKLVFVCLLLSV